MRGFTLIEAIIYLALLSFLMLGCASLVFGVGTNAERDGAELQAVEEGAFVLAKIRWAMHQATGVEDATENKLQLSVTDTAINSIRIDYKDKVIYMKAGSQAREPLTTLTVTTATFTYDREVLSAYFVIDGKEFSTSMYLP